MQILLPKNQLKVIFFSCKINKIRNSFLVILDRFLYLDIAQFCNAAKKGISLQFHNKSQYGIIRKLILCRAQVLKGYHCFGTLKQ